MFALRLDFDYLSELPVLVLDVNDDFKNDRIKQEAIIDKVSLSFYFEGFPSDDGGFICFSYMSQTALFLLLVTNNQ